MDCGLFLGKDLSIIILVMGLRRKMIRFGGALRKLELQSKKVTAISADDKCTYIFTLFVFQELFCLQNAKLFIDTTQKVRI